MIRFQVVTPALQTSRSTRPCSAMAVSWRCWTASRSATSLTQASYRHLGAEGPEVGRRLIDDLLGRAGEHDRRTLAHERPPDPEPDPTRATGDHRDSDP